MMSIERAIDEVLAVPKGGTLPIFASIVDQSSHGIERPPPLESALTLTNHLAQVARVKAGGVEIRFGKLDPGHRFPEESRTRVRPS